MYPLISRRLKSTTNDIDKKEYRIRNPYPNKYKMAIFIIYKTNICVSLKKLINLTVNFKNVSVHIGSSDRFLDQYLLFTLEI